jgi:SAM-dependent methyltransferase
MIKKLQAVIKGLKPLPLEHAVHDYHHVFKNELQDLKNLIQKPIEDISILVIGCGYRYPDVVLLSGVAREVVGLDVQEVFYKDGFLKLLKYNMSQKRGFFSSLYNAYRKRNGVKRYYSYLKKSSKLDISPQKVNLIYYNGTSIPFPDENFDLVISNAVLEHVMDLNTFFKEVQRVTMKSGLSYHHYHNYYSFSGGHLPEKLCLENPWGHLRGIYTTSDSHLNKVTIGEVQSAFGEYFEESKTFPMDKKYNKKTVDEYFSYEKEELLTEPLKKELKDYPLDELLTRAFLIYGYKK